MIELIEDLAHECSPTPDWTANTTARDSYLSIFRVGVDRFMATVEVRDHFTVDEALILIYQSTELANLWPEENGKGGFAVNRETLPQLYKLFTSLSSWHELLQQAIKRNQLEIDDEGYIHGEALARWFHTKRKPLGACRR